MGSINLLMGSITLGQQPLHCLRQHFNVCLQVGIARFELRDARLVIEFELAPTRRGICDLASRWVVGQGPGGPIRTDGLDEETGTGLAYGPCTNPILCAQDNLVLTASCRAQVATRHDKRTVAEDVTKERRRLEGDVGRLAAEREEKQRELQNLETSIAQRGNEVEALGSTFDSTKQELARVQKAINSAQTNLTKALTEEGAARQRLVEANAQARTAGRLSAARVAEETRGLPEYQALLRAPQGGAGA